MVTNRVCLALAASLALVAVMVGPSVAARNSDVLTLGDKAAAKRLKDMAAQGDLTIPGHAAAWVVVSSVALGVGRDQCELPEPGDTSFLVKPALDGMKIEQIITLNRMVTSNYRAAERGGKIDLAKLYPITRYAVGFLGYDGGRFDCERVSEVWNNALSYERNRGR